VVASYYSSIQASAKEAFGSAIGGGRNCHLNFQAHRGFEGFVSSHARFGAEAIWR
jgi:hypothetical protein